MTHTLRRLLKRLSTPVTIMLVPHTRTGSINFRLPVATLILLAVFSLLGVVYAVSLTAHAVDYWRMKKKVDYLSRQFNEIEATVSSLRESESRFRKLFAVNSKKEVLRDLETNLDADDAGSIDLEALKAEVLRSTESVQEIGAYLRKEKDVYRAMPVGWPASGRISSTFGMREHPRYHTRRFHSGMDISLPMGTPVKATADGVVSFSGRSAGNGNIVVIEHGRGFSTVYAHNSRNLVPAGKVVKRGETVALSGSTGVSTGPHLHYEVWKDRKSVNPKEFLDAG